MSEWSLSSQSLHASSFSDFKSSEALPFLMHWLLSMYSLEDRLSEDKPDVSINYHPTLDSSNNTLFSVVWVSTNDECYSTIVSPSRALGLRVSFYNAMTITQTLVNFKVVGPACELQQISNRAGILACFEVHLVNVHVWTETLRFFSERLVLSGMLPVWV